ncbi:hypothetical protein Tco_0721286 [Tanacetum coccineum]
MYIRRMLKKFAVGDSQNQPKEPIVNGYVKERLGGEVGGVENKSSEGFKLMASGKECLDGWVGAGGGEVKGSGIVFGVSRIEFGMIPEDNIGESGGEAFRLDGGAD